MQKKKEKVLYSLSVIHISNKVSPFLSRLQLVGGSGSFHSLPEWPDVGL